MKTIDAKELHYRALNEEIRNSESDIMIENCMGQRFIASGMSGKNIIIHGTPGNALGAYLDGSKITVYGNAQDAVGDTMNDGAILVNGNIGDAPGYGMRGGKIYVRGNAGYRAGIHMKQYADKKPVVIIGGKAGSFLGEYMAGGLIIVLGLQGEEPIAGNFTGTGMHGGKIFLRAKALPPLLPKQVAAVKATQEDLKEIEAYLKEYGEIFTIDYDTMMKEEFFVLKPDTNNPYKRLYTVN